MTETRRRLAHRIADDLEAEIVRRGWPVGEVLGSEAELRERYDVSSATLRQTTRLLESRGTAFMRPGPKGGLVAAAPEGGEVRHVLASYMTFKQLDHDQLAEARSTLELAIVELTAARVSEEDIHDLRRKLADEEKILRSGELPTLEQSMHHVFADHARNPALQILLSALLEVETGWWETGRAGANNEALVCMARQHRDIVDAIVLGDRAMARVRMKQHLDWLVEERRRLDSGDRPS